MNSGKPLKGSNNRPNPAFQLIYKKGGIMMQIDQFLKSMLACSAGFIKGKIKSI